MYLLANVSEKVSVKTEEIERLLIEIERDANTIASAAIRLSNRFGSNSLLSDFIAVANRIRDRVARQRLRVQQLRQQSPSPERNVKIQLLLADANQTESEVAQIKQVIQEIENDV